MLQIKVDMLPYVKGNIIWFSLKPSVFNCLTSFYKQSAYTKPIIGYAQKAFYTKIIDLKGKSSEEILNNFDKKTAYEVRRGLKDGIEIEREIDLDRFIIYYNDFAKTKGLSPLSKHFKNYKDMLYITKASYLADVVVMHAYLVDKNRNRTRLLYSASHFRSIADTQIKAIIGRANRLLHFKDICLFQNLGIAEYDLGGYALNSNDPSLIRINQFKDGFGGDLIQECDYMPISSRILALFSKRFRN